MTNTLWVGEGGWVGDGKEGDRERGREDGRRGGVAWRWEGKGGWEKRREDRGRIGMIWRWEGKGGKGVGKETGRQCKVKKREEV